MSNVYRTPIDSAEVSRAGWLPFPGGLEITAAPLVDATQPGLFARLTYRDALAVATRLGARLLTQAEHDQLWRIGRKLRPVIKSPGPQMASLAYAQQHDVELTDQLTNWDGSVPLGNAGKQWVGGAAPGRALNYGWWDSNAPNGRMWQTLGTTHDDGHTDYSQLTMLVRPAGSGGGRVGEGVAAAGAAIASLAAKAAAALSPPGHTLAPPSPSNQGGHPLPAPLPHGYRCSVAEIVADARRNGTYRQRSTGYVPKLGDLVISARAGQDPETGGSGHVERVTMPAGAGNHPITLGGNEVGDTWVMAPYDMEQAAFRGCVDVPATVGQRAVEIALGEFKARVTEAPGAANNPRIQEYHAGARRGGSALAGMPGREGEGVAVLGAKAADSVAWCASAASFCMYRAVKA